MKKFVISALIMITVGLWTVSAFSQDGVVRITKEDLKAMLGNPDVIILDVRLEPEWRASEKQIQGAVREEPQDFRSWMKKYSKDKTLVFYCS